MNDLLNPYSVGGSLGDPKGAGFYGREDVFEFVAQSLQTARRPPIVLYGQRRIGKSSVLKQLPRHLPADLVCVLFDLQGQAALPLESLLYGLAREIAGRCNLPRPAREQIHADSFADFLAGVAATLGSPRRLVLLFDEFDVVDVGVGTNTAASGFLGYLAGLLERLPELGVVLVVGRKIAELSEAFAGAILRNAVQHRLVRLTRSQSDALAAGLGADTLAFDAGALQALYALAAGHPYCAQLLCNLVWQRNVRAGVVLPALVTEAEVVAAVLPAIEYGTSGMSWIYDGLDVPSHRLFLAALAELQVPADETGLLQLARQADVGSVALTEIEQRLLRSGTQIDAAELRTAPARLAHWDVVDGTSAGYRFAVPLIGLWIRLNRPLAELEAQARLVNPRAWRFYELAAHSQLQEQWDEAIDMYQQALADNPALVEAWLGQGACLRARDRDGDLARAIEAYERALALDAQAPRAALLQLLGEQIERSGHDPNLQAAAYRRLVELDPQGIAAPQAARRMQYLGRLRLGFKRHQAGAEVLFKAIADADGLARLEALRLAQKPQETLSMVAAVIMMLGLVLALGASFLPVSAWWGGPPGFWAWVARLGTAASVAGVVLAGVVDSPAPAWRKALVAGVPTATVLGLAAWGINLAGAWLGSVFVGGMASAALMPSEPADPPELQPPKPAKVADDGRPWVSQVALRMADWLQRVARQQENKS